MNILGIDPGLFGAIAVYDLASMALIEMYDTPILSLVRNGKTKREIDVQRLADIMRVLAPHAAHAWLEYVGAMPGQGVTSVFSFGQTFGMYRMALAANCIPMTLVTPQVWKKTLGVPAAKDGARARASQLMPSDAGQWPRVKDDGRAEAAMIAYYGARHQQEMW